MKQAEIILEYIMYISHYAIANILQTETTQIKKIRQQDNSLAIELWNCQAKQISMAKYQQYLQQFRQTKKHHCYLKIGLLTMTTTALSFIVGFLILQNHSSKMVVRRNLESKSNANQIILLVNLAIANGTIIHGAMNKKLKTNLES